MKHVPLKKKYHARLEGSFSGVFNTNYLSNSEQYVKFISKLENSPIKIKTNWFNRKKRLEEVLICAKAYEVLKKENVYPPDTQPVVCKDDDNYLTLMILMPHLKISSQYTPEEKVGYRDLTMKLFDLEKKYNLEKDTFWDLKIRFNQGCDDNSNRYVHDTHLTKIKGFNKKCFKKMVNVCRRIVENEKLTSE